MGIAAKMKPHLNTETTKFLVISMVILVFSLASFWTTFRGLKALFVNFAWENEINIEAYLAGTFAFVIQAPMWVVAQDILKKGSPKSG